MGNIQISNYHFQYMNVTSQHWNANSEHFAGGDHLLTALHNGWELLRCEEARHWYTGMRSVVLYRFYLKRESDEMMMPVVANPYVERFINQNKLEIKVVETDSGDRNSAA